MPVPSETHTTTSSSSASAALESPEEQQQEHGEEVDEEEEVGSGSSAAADGSNGAEDKPLKLFVGGLSWQTDDDKLRECFEAYGEVTECSIMKDPVQKRSRGFGFVTFADGEAVVRALDAHSECPIAIDDKIIDPKIAIPPKRLSNKVKRIFVGGLSSDSTEDDLREYFEDFGKPYKVCETQLMYDRNTNRHRGFGFVTFESEAPAEKACSIQYHDIRGKKVEVKVAQTKEALAMQQQQQQQQQCRGRSMLPPARPYSYSYYSAPYQPYYGGPYPVDMLGMGAPVLLDGRQRSKDRAGSGGGGYYPGFGYGWPEQPPRYYPSSGYGGAGSGIPMHMMRTPLDSNMIPTSGVDYLSDHFQGMAMGAGYGGYAAQSPHFTPVTVEPPGSYSPPHSHSPKTSGSSNGYSAAYVAGTQSSFAVASY